MNVTAIGFMLVQFIPQLTGSKNPFKSSLTVKSVQFIHQLIIRPSRKSKKKHSIISPSWSRVICLVLKWLTMKDNSAKEFLKYIVKMSKRSFSSGQQFGPT